MPRQNFGDEEMGVFRSGETYSHRAIARRLGKSEARWVIRNMFHKGLVCCCVGADYLTTGEDLNHWIKENSRPWNDTKSSDAQADEA